VNIRNVISVNLHVVYNSWKDDSYAQLRQLWSDSKSNRRPYWYLQTFCI